MTFLDQKYFPFHPQKNDDLLKIDGNIWQKPPPEDNVYE